MDRVRPGQGGLPQGQGPHGWFPKIKERTNLELQAPYPGFHALEDNMRCVLRADVPLSADLSRFDHLPPNESQTVMAGLRTWRHADVLRCLLEQDVILMQDSTEVQVPHQHGISSGWRNAKALDTILLIRHASIHKQ